MISTYLRRIGAGYAGLTPVFAAAALAGMLTAAVWPLLSRVAIYPDVIAGATTFANVDKARDFRALYLFFATTAAFSIALAAFFRRRRPKEGGDEAKYDAALRRMLLICATLPAQWWLAVALTAPPPATYIMPWTTLDAVLGAAVALIALAFVWTGRLAEKVHSVNAFYKTLTTVLSGILGAFAGLGIATAIGRFFPNIGVPLAHRAFLFGAGGATIGLLAGEAVRRQRADSDAQRRQRYARLVAGLQVPLPLLFLVLVPPPLLVGNRIIPAEYKPSLTFSLAALLVIAWVSLWSRSRSVGVARVGERPHMRDSIETWLAPLCIAAVALYVALPLLPVPQLVLHPDHLHFGEGVLAYQQLAEWGKLPYVDFVPIHGLMALSRGFLNSLFFDNAASGFDAAALSLAAMFTVALFLTTRPLIGTPMAVAIAGFSLSPLMSDRFFFFTPALLVLVHPRLLASPVRWLAVWLLVMPTMVLYNVPIGTALTVGTLPAALFMAYRLAHADPRKLIALVLLAVATIVLFAMFPNVQAMTRGFFQYVGENQAVNNLANGIAWEQNFHSPRSTSDLLRQVIWGLTRVSWILVVVIALHLGWRELGRPSEERRQSLLWLVALLTPTLLIVAQWAFGRIDPGGASRTDTLSYVCLFQILPVLMILAWPTSASTRARPSTGLSLVIAAGLISPHGLTRALLGHNTLRPRVVHADRGLVRGRDIGLPNVGVVMPNRTVDEARGLREALAPLLRPGETYLNLGFASAFYYYLDLPVPSIYAEAIVPASGEMQARMLRQLALHPPPVVLISPWAVSLRAYYLYRDCLLRYPAVRRGRFVFLVDPTRAPDAGPIGSDSQIALLDSVYGPPRLDKIPSAWGRSWPTLASRFTSIAVLDMQRVRRPVDISLESKTHWRVSGTRPSLEYSLTDLNLKGRDADFVKLNLASPPGTELHITWSAGGRKASGPIAVTPAGETTALLIPLGAAPGWLVSPRIDALRFELVGAGAVPGKRFTMRDVALLHLNQPDGSP